MVFQVGGYSIQLCRPSNVLEPVKHGRVNSGCNVCLFDKLHDSSIVHRLNDIWVLLSPCAFNNELIALRFYLNTSLRVLATVNLTLRVNPSTLCKKIAVAVCFVLPLSVLLP
jgi:hypothetical protein